MKFPQIPNHPLTNPSVSSEGLGDETLPAFPIPCVCVTIAEGGQVVDRILNASNSEPSPADSRLWIGRFLIAVVLGEAIWGFLVSVTNNLALPAMARAMSDPQSPLSLGKGDFNIPGLFASILELCFAAIVALLVNSWSQRSRQVRAIRTRTVSTQPQPARVAAAQPQPAPVVAPSAPPAAVPANTTIAPQTSATTPSPSEPAPATAPPTKPKKQKAVYYNIVGEQVDPDE